MILGSSGYQALKNLHLHKKIKVKNVSKYVISAAKNPEFAQKLHAVLLESGASPPPDLFSDMNLGESKLLEKAHPENRVNLGDQLLCCLDDMLTGHEQTLMSLTREGMLNNIRCDYEQEQFAEGSADEPRKLNVNISNSDLSFPSDVTSEGFVLLNNRTNEKIANRYLRHRYGVYSCIWNGWKCYA